MAIWNNARKSGLAFRDEDAMPDDTSPYSSISSREPMEDISMQGRADRMQNMGDDGEADDFSDFQGNGYDSSGPSLRQSVMSKISSKMSPKGDYLNDPLMKQYDQKEAELQDLRNQQGQANAMTNFAQAASLAAQGANKPGSADALYKNIGEQGKDMLKSNEEDLDRRQRIVNAIETRKSRESVADQNRLMRQAMLESSSNNRGATRDLQGRRILGQVVNHLNSDPIIKPSETNMASLEKSKAIIDNPDVPLTSQVLSDAEQDIASALTLRGMGATEGKIQRTELVDMNRKFAEVKQKYGNKVVDLRIEAPEVVAQVKKLNNALLDDYKTTVATRKNGIVDQYSDVYGDDPFFAEKLDKLRGGMNTRAGLTAQGKIAQGSSGGLIKDANAGESQGPHGSTVTQNGHTYTWNGQKYVAGGP